MGVDSLNFDMGVNKVDDQELRLEVVDAHRHLTQLVRRKIQIIVPADNIRVTDKSYMKLISDNIPNGYFLIPARDVQWLKDADLILRNLQACKEFNRERRASAHKVVKEANTFIQKYGGPVEFFSMTMAAALSEVVMP